MMSISSCRWVNETFMPVDTCAEWYLDAIYEASENGESGEAAELYRQMEEWYNGLSTEDQAVADETAKQWAIQNGK